MSICAIVLQVWKYISFGGFSAISALTTDNLSKKFLRSVSKERDTAHQEFIEDDSHCPPIHRLPIALPEDHLWGNVLWSATHLHMQTYNTDQYERTETVTN